LNSVFIGAYVPGTGKQDNGMVKETDPGVPEGFRTRFAPQIEPRVGFTYDLTGAGSTVLHSSVGYFHQARLGGGSLGNLAGNPPFIHNPTVFYNTLGNLLAPGNTLSNRPATVEALDMTKYQTPRSINWSAGIRREIGWGTALDVTYAGYKAYDMEMYYDINLVPDGARFTDLHPENRDPTAAATASPTAMAVTRSSRPKASGRPRHSSRGVKPAAPIATSVWPKRQARPKESEITTAGRIPSTDPISARSRRADASGSSGSRTSSPSAEAFD
jgi:hypothetical protein